MKSRILVIFLISIFTSVFAVPVDKSTAETAAKNWLNGKSESKNFNYVSEYINIDNALHVFNFSNGGFVIVAADDASKPILGYSFTDEFNNSDEKSNLNFWLGLYKKAIDEIRTEKLDNSQTVIDWQNILKNNISKKDTKEVLPLLTCTWNQSPVYNMYCPLDGGSLSVVGCVATAMSQIMYYHQYPKTGKSYSSYNILGQSLAVDYYLSRYNWDLMPDAVSSGSSPEAKHEVAQISYHAGVAVEMMYGSDGSGAYSEDVPSALKNYFKYSNATSYVNRSAYNATTWRTLLTSQLDNALPVYYSGQGPAGGHAFVCDGYQDTDYYHFNWGWGGSANGYYSIDNLNPSGMTFNDYQGVVKDIIPKAVDLVLDQPIEDVRTEESSYQIVLSDYFTSLTGDGITYTIDPKSNLNGVQYSIVSGVLTFNKLEDGISHVIVTASTRNDNNFDDFYIQFGSTSLMAGFGKSYNFNSTAYLDAGKSAVADSIKTFSFSSWIKLNSINKDQGIASRSSSSNSGWYVVVQANNLLKFSIKSQDGTTRRIYSLQALEADKWYHIDTVYDGKDLYIYINGELDNSKTTYPASSFALNEYDRNINLGYAYGLYLDGEIDEAVIWNGVVSVPQIRQIMSEKPDVSMDNLVSYWPLNEGFYATAEDVAGLHNGTFINNDLGNWVDSEAPLYFFMDWNTTLNSKLLGSTSDSAVYSITQAPTLGNFDFSNSTTGEFSYDPDTNTSGLEEIKYTITYNKSTTPVKTVLINVKETTGIEEDNSTPAAYELFQNYPNPFNPVTEIKFALHNDGIVKFSIFNSRGETVADVKNEKMVKGLHTVSFDASALNSGVYFYQLNVNGISETKKMVLTK